MLSAARRLLNAGPGSCPSWRRTGTALASSGCSDVRTHSRRRTDGRTDPIGYRSRPPCRPPCPPAARPTLSDSRCGCCAGAGWKPSRCSTATAIWSASCRSPTWSARPPGSKGRSVHRNARGVTPASATPSRPFGSLARAVAVIGQGSWRIDSGDRRAAIAALRRGIDLGMTHIDTAEMYGAAEEMIGRGHRRTPRRGLPRLEGAPEQRVAAAERSRPASDRSPASAPTGSTATSCTGAVDTRSRTRSPHSSSSGARARSCPGA